MSDPVSDLKHELLAAAERQHEHPGVRSGRKRLHWHLSRNRLLLTSAALSAVAAVALLFTAPWNSSPGFLARAEAALTPPAGTILHMKWESTETPNDPPCTATRGPSEIWIDQTEPHRYHALLDYLPLGHAADPRACSSGTPLELGGTLTFGAQAEWALKFVPPNRLSFNPETFNFPWDPVADLRQTIKAGRAHDEGKTRLDGRTVERIRLEPPSRCPSPCPPAFVYVDPETFYPVQTDAFATFAPIGGPVTRFRSVTRYLTFEYLPRTAANLALTDIHAQHPNAVGP
jgi:hypothetical protein